MHGGRRNRMTIEQEHSEAFLAALDGIDTVYDFRAMHDRDKGAHAKTWRGRFRDIELELRAANAAGYGIHIMINPTDGLGRLLANVTACRAQLLDLDGVDAMQQLSRVMAHSVPPHMIVNTSPNKFQLWFKVIPHGDRELFSANQKRLIGAFNGDSQFIDAAHTARLPGFYHHKAAPHLVTVAAGPVWGGRAYDPWEIAAPLLHVPIVGAGVSDRRPLGYPEWSAPSLEWLNYALWKIDPNALSRADWIAITAATKQAGWNFGPDVVRTLWDNWCAWYRKNDLRENDKNWRDIDATSAGWNALVKRAGIGGDLMLAGMATPLLQSSPTSSMDHADMPGLRLAEQSVSVAGLAAASGPLLTPDECRVYFAGCFWITEVGKILGPNGRLMDATKFNGLYGGKAFMMDAAGNKVVNEPWQAALRSQAWTVPKVDHMRFMPALEYGAVVVDEFGRSGVNTYRKPVANAVPGDITPFLDHVVKLLPIEHDRAVLFAFLAQCVQRPGVKIGWAVLLQSMEGAGKTIFRQILECALGQSYVYGPNARELSEGGGKFNGWMRNRLMMVVDEIRTDEKRELIEIMKPWITEYRIEMQNKGQDQEMSDNPTNWLLFTNYKDAIPINDKSRRFAVLFSAIQEQGDLKRLGMDGRYFSALYRWMASGGAAAVCDWLLRYSVPIALDAAAECTRAPVTSSTAEAIEISRGWLEMLIAEAIDAGRQGFRGGWVSTVALAGLLKETGHKPPGPRSIAAALASLGFVKLGKAPKIYPQEFAPYQSYLYARDINMSLANYGVDQGYEFVP